MLPFLQRDERGDRLALDLVRPADDGGFGDLRMIDERALDFHRAEAMPRDVQHVVDAAEQPEVAVLVAARAVAGEVRAVGPLAPVPAARSARDRRRCRAASPATACVSASSPPPRLDALARLLADLGRDAGERLRRRARLRAA